MNNKTAGMACFESYGVPGSPVGRILSTADRIAAEHNALADIRRLAEHRNITGTPITAAEILAILRRHRA